MRWGLSSIVRRRTRPPLVLGIVVAVICVAAETLLAGLLMRFTPVRSLDVVYLLGIVAVAAVWGMWLGLATAALSTLALDYFLTPPTGSLELSKAEDWTVLAIFIAVMLLATSISRLARSLAVETDARAESDLAADLARVLLHAPDVTTAEPQAAGLLSRTLDLPYARIERGAVPDDEDHVTFPMRDRGIAAARLVVPAGVPKATLRRLRDRVVPSMEILLQAAHERQRVADQQVALRRLATLVARNAPPGDLFGAVAREVGQAVEAPQVAVIRYEPGTTATNVGAWSRDPADPPSLNVRWPVEKGGVAELVARTGEPGRIGPAHGSPPAKTAVGCPVQVGGRLWGAVIAVSASEPLPDDTEKRMIDFTDLLVTAIANAESHAKLEESRARVIAAADATRRLIERDLHDGVQQRLVALILELRTTATPPAAQDKVGEMLLHTVRSLEESLEDLRGLARGLHPALLSRRGLEPAINALARCSAVPVVVNVCADRLAERIEVTAYHIVSEALMNAAKHADASVIHVDLTVEDAALRLSVRDDGTGGADPRRGSGLLGINDRVEALGGRLEIESPEGAGTSLYAEIPITNDR